MKFGRGPFLLPDIKFYRYVSKYTIITLKIPDKNIKRDRIRHDR